MPDSIGHPGFLDSLIRGNDTDGCFIEFVITFENRCSDTKTQSTSHSAFHSFFTVRAALSILALAWVLTIAFVGVSGEFMVNDDWSFVRAYERFANEGRIGSTGWGPEHAPGGPALLVHMLWARPFTLVFGDSVTTLRLSVLVMAILGSAAMWALLRSAGASPLMSLLGSLTLIFNPFYLSLSFTFMTDVPCTALSLWGIFFLSRAVATGKTKPLIIGFLFCLAAILVRQLGVVLVLGFLACCLFHTEARELGFVRCLAWATGLVFLPWLIYELSIAHVGGTFLTQHQAVGNIIKDFSEHSWAGYLDLLFGRLLGAAVYCGIFTSPIWLLRFDQFLAKKGFRWFLAIALAAFVSAQVIIATDWLALPIFFWGNVIFNFGIGPILLKDTAILKIIRTATIPAWAYYSWALVATVGVGIIVGRTRVALMSLFGKGHRSEHMSFPAALALASSAFYLAIICASWSHDRYLLPVMAFLVVWLCGDDPARGLNHRRWWTMLASVAMIAVIAGFTLIGTRDFFQMKRALKTAQDYVVTQLGHDPCSYDGGFEFNGYHCYDRCFRPKPGLSWWWVHDEKSVLTLGPLPGYRVEHVVPFRRIMGPDGAIHVLARESK